MKNKIYNTNDLVIAAVCPIKMSNDGTIWTLTRNSFYVIAKKNVNKYLDIINNKEYNFFKKVNYDYKKQNLDELYISNVIFLNYQLKESRQITMEEIVSLYNKLNEFKNDRKKDDVSDKEKMIEDEKKPNDYFLQQIIITKNKISVDMNQTVKDDFINELSILASEYVEELKQVIGIGLSSKKLYIISKYMDRLVDIEFRILDYNKNIIPQDNLKNDLEMFNSLIKR